VTVPVPAPLSVIVSSARITKSLFLQAEKVDRRIRRRVRGVRGVRGVRKVRVGKGMDICGGRKRMTEELKNNFEA